MGGGLRVAGPSAPRLSGAGNQLVLMGTNVFLDLAGGIALLLWGMHMVQTGVMRAFGADLRRFLASALRNRFRAFLVGVGVTGILQSSTATGLMVAGFSASGLI